MKILFIENRQRTFFWDIVAEVLAKKGHDIFGIVQISFYKYDNWNLLEDPVKK